MSPIPPHIIETFRRNIAALSEIDPTTTKQIDASDWSNNIVFKPALDGTMSAFGPELSKSGWFAASGAPTIREKVLTDNMSVENVNLILPGSGHGEGLRRLLLRIKPWQSIFVHEPNIRLIAILLSLNDFSSAIKNRQLILLTQDDLKDSLVVFFEKNPSFIVPTRMLSWPWLSEREATALSQKVEMAITEINQQIGLKTSHARQELLDSYQANGNTEQIEIISLTDKVENTQLVENIHSALKKLKKSVGKYMLDCPEHNGIIALVQRLSATRPGTIFSIGLTRKQLNLHLPPTVRFISLISSPGEEVSEQLLNTLPLIESNEHFIIGNRKYFEILKPHFAESQISLMDIAVDPEIMALQGHETKFRICIFGDKIEADAKALGIRQKSQQALWQTVGKVISESPLTFKASDTDDWITRASDRIGVKLSDPKLSESFSYLVKHHLAPSMIRTSLMRQLKQSNISFRLFGNGWESDEEFKVFAEPLPKNNQSFINAFERCDFIFCIDHHRIIPDALCCGKPVIILTLPANLCAYPEVHKGLLILDSKHNFIQQMKMFLQKYQTYREQVSEVRNYITANFSYEQQIAPLLEQ